jgi:hypothetical protein
MENSIAHQLEVTEAAGRDGRDLDAAAPEVLVHARQKLRGYR